MAVFYRTVSNLRSMPLAQCELALPLLKHEAVELMELLRNARAGVPDVGYSAARAAHVLDDLVNRLDYRMRLSGRF